MIQTITLGGKNLADFGVVVSGEGTYDAPERSVTEEVVPGRNGTLLIDNGRFENVVVTYPAAIVQNFQRNMEGLRNYIQSVKGYIRLEDSYHPDVFYLAMPTGGISVKTSGYMNREGQFDLEFTRKPQRFLKSGENVIRMTATGNVYNPTAFDALPLVRIWGNGTVLFGGTSVTWSGPSIYVDIDCDIQDAYYMGSNMNQYIQLSGYDFPKLEPGETQITIGEGVTSVEITPRWWIL